MPLVCDQMQWSRHIFYCFFCAAFLGLCGYRSYAQPGFQVDIKKPPPYENRVLKAEKTDNKKLRNSKRFFQNLTTHYNYFFNANSKLNEVIDRAKTVHRDDYTELLSFYNYSLDVTAQDKNQLDSVIYKSQTGILLHDLRGDWMDNLYLLWGAAFYLEKKFDSAALMFQFVNYAFAEKEKDGYYRYIGSRLDGNDAGTIATKENDKLIKRITSTPPSRNDAFIWRIKTLIAMGNFSASGSLITTLLNDPLFPKRLNSDLEEMQSLWFYKQNLWDSAARHLIKALDKAPSSLERARWEFLAAQMFERTNQMEEARTWYQKSIDHTTDPVMEVYARLNVVRVNKSGGDNYIDKNIAELVRMAKRDRYLDYRDVIYYMAAQMELARNNTAAAHGYLLKSAKYNHGNFNSRSNAYLLIADLSYDQKRYLQAASFYDSIQVQGLEPSVIQRIESRKATLAKIVTELSVIARQDSLQKIAAMPEQERTAYITRLLRQLRRQKGLQDEASSITSGGVFGATASPTLFNDDAKGEWYFYNTSLKSQGAVQFKQIWGSRPNVDNWRRFSNVNQQLLASVPNNTRPNEIVGTNPADEALSFNSLYNNLPMTDVRLQASNDSVRNAMFRLGVIYLNNMEDYPSAIEIFEKLRARFPAEPKMDELLFNLYYSYSQSGQTDKAAEIKKLLIEKFPGSRFTKIITLGKDPAITAKTSPEETKAYEDIYDLFLAGKFSEAEDAKKSADSLYKTNYWQPQLLYIEAVYQIRLRNDSLAKNTLQKLIGQNPASALGKKAQNLLQVLMRRKQIEDELTRLQIETAKEDSVIVRAPKPVTQGPIVKQADREPDLPFRQRQKDSIAMQRNGIDARPNLLQSVDSAGKRLLVKPSANSVYQFDPAATTYAMIILDKVDVVFVGEAKNAFNRYNQEKYYNQVYNINTVSLNADSKLLLIGDFPNAAAAVDWIQQAKKVAANEIVPWLKPDKFSFSLMTDWNLEILKSKQNLDVYQKFLGQKLPGKF